MSPLALHLRAMAAVWHSSPVASVQHDEAGQTLAVIVASMFEQSLEGYHGPR
jgi:hypothetical protein